MKTTVLLVLFLVPAGNFIAQISESNRKKISRIVGKDFIVLPNQKSYPYSDYSDHFKVDLSTTHLTDTTGVSFQNEYLIWHDLISFCGKQEILKLVKPSYVSVSEYREFQNYVRDSIARETIFFTLGNHGRRSGYKNEEWESDEDVIEWINFKETYWDKDLDRYVEVDPSDRELCRKLFTLNWDKPLNYHDPKVVPCIAGLYLSVPERFYKIKEFDQRKMMYKYHSSIKDPYSCSFDSLFQLYPFQKLSKQYSDYFQETAEIIIEEEIARLMDTYSWSGKSVSERDEFSVLGQTYNSLFKNAPVVGINNPQAKAFCHWKQEVLQKQLDEKKLPYQVIISLPSGEDQELLNQKETVFTVPAKDFTAQWRIINKDYDLFVKVVQDSILRDGLYLNVKSDDEAQKIINYHNFLYFDENTWEYTEYDPSDRTLGRSIFYLNPEFKYKSLSPDGFRKLDSLKKEQEYTYPYYHYYTIEAKAKSIRSGFIIYDINDGSYKLAQQKDSLDKWAYPLGKNMNLNYTNLLGETSDIHSHENYQAFIISMHQFVLPEAASIKVHPDSLIQTITYEQALAFYNWKYPIHKASGNDDWQKFVLPTKEQFEAVQQGKQMIVPEKKVAYPTPLFRYVVHVYPK